MINTNDLIIAVPKGRILNEIIPILNQVGIIPHHSFFDKNCRKLKFSTNIKNIKLIRVRSFDVATFLTYGAAHLAIIGSDVLEEFSHSEIYSPLDFNIGLCRLVIATKKDMIEEVNPIEWSHVRVATKYPNTTFRFFQKRGIYADCIKLNGAMELAPNMGLCKRIVDLVSSGKTLEANNLIEIEEITKVSTRLAINKGAYKTNLNEIKGIIDMFESVLNDKKK